MFSFQLSAEQEAFRDAVKDFVIREVRPAANHPDRLQAGPSPLPCTILAQASQMGLRTMALSEARGGAGVDHLTECLLAEELAAGDAGFAATLLHTAQLGRALFDRAMSEEQRQHYLATFLEDDHFHLAYAGCDYDPDEGGWNYHRKDQRDIEVPVTAVPNGGDWRLDGEYAFVANAPLAKLFAVRVRQPTVTAVVLVPVGAAGMSVSDVRRVHGEGGAPVFRPFLGTGGAVRFNDCRVPAAQVMPGCDSLLDAAALCGRGSPVMQALNLGVGRAAYEAAVDYAKLRIQGGRLIIEHQAIGTILAEVAIRLETARNLVWKAAWAADHPQSYASISALPLQAMAKAYVSQAIEEATLLAAECFGAMGVMKDMTLPHYVNDARMFVHSEFSNTTAKLRVAEAIAGFRRD